MIRTHEAHRYRPRVQYSTPEREGVGTSRVAVAHSPAQVIETPPTLAPATAMIQGPALLLFQRRLKLLSPHPSDTRPEWDLGPLLL